MNKRDIIQEDALSVLLSSSHCGIAMSMGAGKTLVGLRHMDKHFHEESKFLVVAPKVSIFQEWKDQANKFGLSHLVDCMHFSTYLSLEKQDLDYDVVYLDECHSLKYSHDVWLGEHKGKIVGLTGTPPKYATSEKGKMVNRYCPIKYTYTTDSAIEDNILNDYIIKVHKIRLGYMKTLPVKTKNGVFMTSESANYLYWCDRIESARSGKELQMCRVLRMKTMQTYKTKDALAKMILDNCIDKTILFANTQEQADSFGIPSYHSSNPLSQDNLEDFKAGNINKLACVLQLSEGVNIPELREGIIMHAYGNERKSSQRIGRLLRLNPDDVATVHILCYKGTVDEEWVNSALEDLDQSKIQIINY